MNYGILLAGGKGERFLNASVPKQFAELCGVPMIVYSLMAAEKSPYIDEVCVVCPEPWSKKVSEWIVKYGIKKAKNMANAGKNRRESVYNGLRKICAKDTDNVIILTSVCPFLSQSTIKKNFEALKKHEAAITVVKATDAITFSCDGKTATRTMQKKKMFIQQGPQSFKYRTLMLAHRFYEQEMEQGAAFMHEVNEDSELVLNMGGEVAMVLGDRFCVKVTYPEDLAIASALKGLFENSEGNSNA
jgi:2-C-methyl-D-erythritol 4-phosphate cytidylyltransferase